MATATKRTHKHFQLDSSKIKRAQKALRAATETETIERALDIAIEEHEKNRIVHEANERFLEEWHPNSRCLRQARRLNASCSSRQFRVHTRLTQRRSRASIAQAFKCRRAIVGEFSCPLKNSSQVLESEARVVEEWERDYETGTTSRSDLSDWRGTGIMLARWRQSTATRKSAGQIN